ncbi:MAG TPA: ABC transporter permease [Terriglobales bacterium]|nr:ABC transporter permease [Terriglobales bacterium]
MRNTWLVIRREYIERVRAKSFLISTLLIPAFIYAVTVLPTQLATRKASSKLHLAIATSNARTGEAIANQLRSVTSGNKYQVDVKTADDPQLRANLRSQVESGAIDGYLWLTDDAISQGKVEYAASSTSDFVQIGELHSAVNTGVTRARLAERGVSPDDAEKMLKRVDVDTVEIKGGQEKKGPGEGKFFAGFAVAMMLYFMLIFHGMAVMRSVLEEKTSRVMEVMLSSVNAKDLMAGKIIGVGAVGLTQTAIWVILGLAGSSPMFAASKNLREIIASSSGLLIWLPVYFVLGFLLYSGLYAALGAAVNSDQEAQQLQFFVTMPLIIPIVIMTMIIRQPDSTASFWLSMVPFFSPILMTIRIAMHTPPVWQIALSVAILLVTMYLILSITSRIYRVGILMYGKRPTLPEIVRWLKYA